MVLRTCAPTQWSCAWSIDNGFGCRRRFSDDVNVPVQRDDEMRDAHRLDHCQNHRAADMITSTIFTVRLVRMNVELGPVSIGLAWT